jgi:hypothetical protein
MTKNQVQLILNETVKTFGAQEWFRDVAVYAKHPHTGIPTLEFRVNYIPILGQVRRAIVEYAQKCNLTERFVVVDKEGNPVE